MTYQVLARRLRPQRFADVVGQEHVTRTLQAAIAAGRVAHAFLFTGPRGVGKTTTARILARAINCERGPTPEPCGTCSTCREIADGQAFDVLEIDGASHTQVDKMRDLMETVANQPIKSRFKIYIIDEVHMLSSHSFNALLKTLEEPPPHVKFIFATTDPHKVLPTVISRCQRYDLRRIGVRELVVHLRAVCEAEGATLPDAAYALIAREAEGSLRDAQSLTDQVLAAGRSLDEAAVRALLGAADRRLVIAVADAVLASDPRACLEQLGQLYGHGYDAQRFCRDLLEHFRNLAVLRTTNDRRLVGDLPEAEAEALVAQAERRSADDLQRFFRLLLDADEALGTPTRTIDPQLVLEMAVLRLATLPSLVPLDELVARLEGTGAGGAALTGGARSTAPATAGTAPATAAAADGDLWQRLLAHLQQEKVSLYMSLASGRPLGIADGVFRIGVENEAMRRDLVRKETLERLQAAATAVAGRPLRVEVGPVPTEQAGDTPLARARKRSEDTRSDPFVQEAVEMFGAELRGVRDRRP